MDDLDIIIEPDPFVLFLSDIFKSDLNIKKGSFLDSLEGILSEPIIIGQLDESDEDLLDLINNDYDDGDNIDFRDIDNYYDLNYANDHKPRPTLHNSDEIDFSIDVPNLHNSTTVDFSKSTVDDFENMGLTAETVHSAQDLGIHTHSQVRSEPASRDPIPSLYYSLKSWPSSTTLECWACGCIPPERVWSIPILESKMAMRAIQKSMYDEIIDPSSLGDDTVLLENTKTKQVAVKKMHGVFCNVACVGRHIKCSDDPIIQSNKWQCLEFTKKLYKEWEKKELIEIPISLHPWELYRRNGKPNGLSDQEYYQKNLEKIVEYTSKRF